MFKRLDQDGNGDLTEVANMFMHSGDLLLSQNIKIINHIKIQNVNFI